MSKQYTSKSQPPKRTTTGHESQDVMRNDLLLLTKMSRENPIGNTTLAVQLLWIPTAADAFCGIDFVTVTQDCSHLHNRQMALRSIQLFVNCPAADTS
ncbi:hypothetical protein ACI65C_000256 [Semiaphis heraclei]